MNDLDVNAHVMGSVLRWCAPHTPCALVLGLGALAACGDHRPAQLDASLTADDGGTGSPAAIPSDASTASDGGTQLRDGDTQLQDSAATDATLSERDAALHDDLGFPLAPSRRLAVGTDGVCVVAEDHTVQCSDQRTPRDSENHGFVRIAGAGYTVCGIRTDKSMYCWYGTASSADQVPPNGGFNDLAGPSNSNCGLGEDGAVHCAASGIGLNATYAGPYLQFDMPDDHEFCAVTPGHAVRCVDADGATTEPPFGSNVQSVQAVQGGLCVGLIGGGIRCLQNSGGTWTDYGQPVMGEVLEFVGSQSLCYVAESGTATCARFAGVQQLEPPADVRFVALGISALRACGISDGGDVWCWEDLKQPGGGGKPAYKVPFAKRAFVR